MVAVSSMTSPYRNSARLWSPMNSQSSDATAMGDSWRGRKSALSYFMGLFPLPRLKSRMDPVRHPVFFNCTHTDIPYTD